MKILTLFTHAGIETEVAATVRQAGLTTQSCSSLSSLLVRWRDPAFQPDAVLLEACKDQLLGWLAVLRPKALGRTAMLVVGRSECRVMAEALAQGADDYVVLRDGEGGLVERLEAHVRRRCRHLEASRQIGGYRLDPARFTMCHRGQELALTAKEFTIASRLLGERGRVVSAEVLLDQTGTEKRPASKRALEPHIHSLRRKCADAFGCALNIRTIHGVGYRLDTSS